MFLPKVFSNPTGYVDPYYQNFMPNSSFLSNSSPFIFIFAFVVTVYLIFWVLSLKKMVKNKNVRHFAKTIRKYRLKYHILHDAFWFTFLYAFFMAIYQFKQFSFNSTLDIINFIFAALITFVYFSFTVYIIYLGYKYRKEEDKIPRKLSFIAP
jgi:hypothetical protein